MLNGDVQIVTDLGFCPNHLDQFIRDLLRITVENADPENPGNLSKPAKQQVQRFLSIEIQTVEGSLLGDKDQLLHTGFRQTLCLFRQFLHGNTSIGSAHLWNDTIGTVFVAALCDLQISVMSAGSEHSVLHSCGSTAQFPEEIRFLPCHCALYCRHDILDGHGAYHRIHFRDLTADVRGVALSQTARHHQSLQLSRFLQLCQLQDSLNALLLGISDKAAGIYHSNIRLGLVIGKGISLLPQKSQHHLCIHQIFVTA